MHSRKLHVVALSGFLICLVSLALSAQDGISEKNSENYRMLFKSLSNKNLVATTNNTSFLPSDTRDTLRVIAFRIGFNNGERDTSTITTGTGLFGVFDESQEVQGYGSDTIYTYDDLPHDRTYFSHQLDFVQDYFSTVSRGRLTLTHEVYPEEEDGAYYVPHTIDHYSPGGKRKPESWDEFYERKTVGLMRFIQDAVKQISSEAALFATLTRDSATGVVRDSTGRKVVFLFFHAGSSYLTDGGEEGAFGQDTPSDMIDAFVTPDWFDYYKDSLDIETNGLYVRSGTDSILLDEIMLVSETSNQDELNWGIHGILVNQIARQLGIPDLWSTASGISGIGAFCIMDFAGYSAGYGFIPPWPSAWVRLFMGWDTPVVVDPSNPGTYRLRAVSATRSDQDTTMLMVPLNDHEYFLIENRQRDLTGTGNVFHYDTTDEDNVPFISPYPYNVELDNAVDSTSDASNTILQVSNYDVSLPASGVLVWHVDERVIQERIELNMVNADSTYRGVSLVEADGITDLGIQFIDIFSQMAYDYGGAEDVFPHTKMNLDRKDPYKTSSFGPFTRPSTRTNDGGHSHLNISIEPSSSDAETELALIREHFIHNYVDSIFEVSVSWAASSPDVNAAKNQVKPEISSGWPRQVLRDSMFLEPVLCDIYKRDTLDEIILFSTDGKMYVHSTEPGYASGFGDRLDSTRSVHVAFKDSISPSDSSRAALQWNRIAYSAAPANAVAFPTVIDGKVYLPAGQSVHILDSVSIADPTAVPDSAFTASWREITLPSPAVSYVSHLAGDAWAVGCRNGLVFFSGTSSGDTATVSLNSTNPVSAIAALQGEPQAAVAITDDGTVYIVHKDNGVTDSIGIRGGIGPYSVVTGDLDNDGATEIVISDSRQGLWCFNRDLALANGWENAPVEWASVYTYVESISDTVRNRKPRNFSAPSLADIDSDEQLEILIGGTNGLYAFNHKGVLVPGWPSYLDNQFWFYRKSLNVSPVVLRGTDGDPLALFGSPTGEHETYTFFEIDSTDQKKSKVYFTRDDGTVDSIGQLAASLVDTLLVYGDSLVPDYILPGGLLDARDERGKRPEFKNTNMRPNIGGERQSFWPFSVGSAPSSAPVLGDADRDGMIDVYMISDRGWLYRWELANTQPLDSSFWRQTGYDASRGFAYRGNLGSVGDANAEPLSFYSYPNPTNGADAVQFRFAFGGPAKDVRLDIFTYTGYHVYSWQPEDDIYQSNWNGVNELPEPISLRTYGPGVYRCRMEATIDGEKEVKFWKMAVVK